MCTLFLSLLWTSILQNNQIMSKQCFVREDRDTFTLIVGEHNTFATDKDVAANFDFIIFNLWVQAILMCTFCGLQLVGIYLVNSLLYYRFWISRVNKCVLLYGLAVFILLCRYRFSQPGRVCSGDYLSAEDWNDPQTQDLYLLY
jgi:hypothetical protein